MAPQNQQTLIDTALAYITQAVDIALGVKFDTQTPPDATMQAKMQEMEKLLGDAHYTLRYVNESLSKHLE